MDDTERARYLMKIAAGFIRKYAAEKQYLYDEAMCDGECLAYDLMLAAQELPTQEVGP